MKQSTPSVLNPRELTLLALFAALMVTLQVVMSFIPNVHPVALLVILLTVHLGWKAMFSVAAFVILEGLIYGFGIWWFNYLYVWPILVCVVMALRRHSSPLLWAMVAAIYGLLFGTLCSVPYFVTGGWAAGIAYIIAGIPYDVAHCFGNLAAVALLYVPLDRVMVRCLTPKK